MRAKKDIWEKARDFRLWCYRRLLLLDPADDYAVQDYQEDWQQAQRGARRCLAELDRHALTAAQQAELLLTSFVGLQLGFRNQELLSRATDRARHLLPQLSEHSSFSHAPAQGKLLCHLLVYLYDETGDELMQDDINRLFSGFPRPLTQEDGYLREVYRNTVESIPYRMCAV